VYLSNSHYSLFFFSQQLAAEHRRGKDLKLSSSGSVLVFLLHHLGKHAPSVLMCLFLPVSAILFGIG
jgi:hypothetical protein